MINDYQKKGVPPATSWRMPPGKSHWIPWQSATHCPNAHNSADKTRAKHCRGGGNEAEIPSFAQCKVPLPNFVSIFLVLLPVSNTTHRHLSFKNQGHRHTQQKTWQNRRTSWQPAKFRRHQPSVIKKNHSNARQNAYFHDNVVASLKKIYPQSQRQVFKRRPHWCHAKISHCAIPLSVLSMISSIQNDKLVVEIKANL